MGLEAHSETVSSAPRESSALVLSSSEEEASASTDRDEAVDLPPQSVSFEGASENQARRTLPVL